MSRRIILDTNVIVAGLRSKLGASHLLLSQIGTGVFDHFVSVGLLFEYEAVLNDPRTGIILSRKRIEDVLDYLVASGQQQEIHYLWRPVLRDLGNDLVLEVAVAGGCDTIVTFNTRDFRGSERFGIRVLSPREFLTELEIIE